MGFVDRILTILNEIILLLWQIFKHTLFVLIPRPVRKLFRYITFALMWCLRFLGRATKVVGIFLYGLGLKIISPFVRFEKAFQEVIGALVEQVRGIQVKDLTPQNIAQQFLKLGVFFLQSLLYLWKKTWGDMNNGAIAAICSLFFVCVFASWQIYKIGDKLYVEIAYGGRKPASTFEQESTLKRRPVYYKQEQRYYDLKQMRIPVYIENERSVKIFEVDVTIEASNRFVKRFFSENENLIRDRMLSTTEPMIHRFPLSDEGKQVMKEKITNELNHFITENHMEGEVSQVYFNAIVAL